MASVVSLAPVIKRHVRGKQSIEVLHELDLEIPAREFLAPGGSPTAGGPVRRFGPRRVDA